MRSAAIDSFVASCSPTLGRRRVVMRTDPSSSFGMNSVPILDNEPIAITTSATAAMSNGCGRCITPASTRR